jgi:hypothetical protein
MHDFWAQPADQLSGSITPTNRRQSKTLKKHKPITAVSMKRRGKPVTGMALASIAFYLSGALEC